MKAEIDKTKIYGINKIDNIIYYNVFGGFVYCGYNYLKELHLPDNCDYIEELNCTNNYIEELIIPKTCTNLHTIWCFNNPNLKTIQIPKNLKLTHIICDAHHKIVNKKNVNSITYMYENR